MVHTPKTIHVQPDSELDRLLQTVGDAPIQLERRGVRYRLSRLDTPMVSPPSPEQIARSIEGTRQASGGWNDLIDAEGFTEYVRRRRRESSRPPVKL